MIYTINYDVGVMTEHFWILRYLRIDLCLIFEKDRTMDLHLRVVIDGSSAPLKSLMLLFRDIASTKLISFCAGNTQQEVDDVPAFK